jgi:hypothetical protein
MHAQELLSAPSPSVGCIGNIAKGKSGGRFDPSGRAAHHRGFRRRVIGVSAPTRGGSLSKSQGQSFLTKARPVSEIVLSAMALNEQCRSGKPSRARDRRNGWTFSHREELHNETFA